MEQIVAKAGYEDIYNVIKSNIDNLESQKAQELAELQKGVDEKYATRLDCLKSMLDQVSEVVEIEEVVEVEETENSEESASTEEI